MKLKNQPQTRELPKTGQRALSFELIQRAEGESSGAEDSRVVTLAFASETPVERGWWIEVLGCTPEECDLSRVNDGAPLLWNHNRDLQIGVVVPGSVTFADGKIRCDVRFSKSAEGERYYRDVLDGIITKVSVGYRISAAEQIATPDGEEDQDPAYRVTSWTPFEVSLVSIPADNEGSGVGRAQAELPVPEQTTRTVPTPSNPSTEIRIMQTEITEKPADPVAAERARVQEITAIAERTGDVELARTAIARGDTVDAFRAAIVAKLAKPVANASLGLRTEEVRQYSMMRLLNALATGDWSQAGYERELSSELAARTGKQTAGALVPMDIQSRALNGITAADGGHTVKTSLLSNSFIDIQRNAQVVSQLGITTLNNLVGKIAIPKRTAAGTVYWVDPDGEVGASGSVFAQVQMSAKTIGAYTDINRSLLKQSDLSAEAFVMSSMAKDVGGALDKAVFHGTGADGQPLGIFNQTGVQVVELGENGAALDWADIVALETKASEVNCDTNSMALVTTPGVRGFLKTTPKFAGTATPIWEGSEVNGYRAFATNQIRKDFTKGTGTALHGGVFGDFSNVVMGNWGVLDLSVDTTTLGTSGGVRIITLQDVDMALRLAQAFALFKDAQTA